MSTNECPQVERVLRCAGCYEKVGSFHNGRCAYTVTVGPARVVPEDAKRLERCNICGYGSVSIMDGHKATCDFGHAKTLYEVQDRATADEQREKAEAWRRGQEYSSEFESEAIGRLQNLADRATIDGQQVDHLVRQGAEVIQRLAGQTELINRLDVLACKAVRKLDDQAKGVDELVVRLVHADHQMLKILEALNSLGASVEKTNTKLNVVDSRVDCVNMRMADMRDTMAKACKPKLTTEQVAMHASAEPAAGIVFKKWPPVGFEKKWPPFDFEKAFPAALFPPLPEDMNTCHGCRWFNLEAGDPLHQRFGTCRLSAPHAVGGFPTVNTTDWCGEWESMD